MNLFEPPIIERDFHLSFPNKLPVTFQYIVSNIHEKPTKGQPPDVPSSDRKKLPIENISRKEQFSIYVNSVKNVTTNLKCGVSLINNFGYVKDDQNHVINYEALPIDHVQGETVYESTSKIFVHVGRFIQNNFNELQHYYILFSLVNITTNDLEYWFYHPLFIDSKFNDGDYYIQFYRAPILPPTSRKKKNKSELLFHFRIQYDYVSTG